MNRHKAIGPAIVSHALLGYGMTSGTKSLRSLWLCLSTLLMAGAVSPAGAAECKLGVMANLPVTMEDLRASVPMKVNGKDTSFWLDSGAFFSLMSEARAKELELPLSSMPDGFYLVGIGGRTSARLATIKSFGIVGQEIKNVQFLVGGSDMGNGLIGRNILAMADTEFDLAHGSVKLINPHDCDKAMMAYWTNGQPYFTAPLLSGPNTRDRHFGLPVSINGAKIEAEFDTGATTSLLSRKAAERAGIDLFAPGVTPLNAIGGLGRRFSKGWVVPVDNVAIGDEQILKTRLVVIDGPIVAAPDAPDMLLGADFMLAHHIYVARRQNRIYFTYSGGKPFFTGPAPSAVASASSSGPVALPPGTRRVEALANPDLEPKTAADFARRGNARLAQRALPEAISDLTQAVRLSPDTAEYYSQRARAYGASGKGQEARADVDKGLALDPGNGDLLLARASMRLAQDDRTGALADAEAAAKVTHSASLDFANLAALFERLGQPARAATMLDDVIALHRADSGLGNLLNSRCWSRALANIELAKALADCNAAIKRDGVNAAYLDSRGLVYFRMNDMAKALADYNAALKLSPEMDWSLYMRGFVKIKQGLGDEGKADQAAAIAISPGIAKEVRDYGIAD